MKYFDRVYGEVMINEPVLIDLILSAPLQRLKEIDQAGYFHPFFPGYSHSRFEHSIGVMLLLKKYNASMEEQIAGLIHDVSHTVFSHCIDYLLNEVSPEKQDYQDNMTEGYVLKSEIPEILQKHGFQVNEILNDKNFPLKERDLPDLCADRIDYSLRTARVMNVLNQREADELLSQLQAIRDHWVFSTETSAASFAEVFRKVNSVYYSGIESAVMFQTVADYLRQALMRNYISFEDIYTTDENVLAKIRPHHKEDELLNKYFKRMNNQVQFVDDPKNFTSVVRCKSRVVDPFCAVAGVMKKLSEVRASWKEVLSKESASKVYHLRFTD